MILHRLLHGSINSLARATKVVLFCACALSAPFAGASDWKRADLPAYAQSVPHLVIGSNGLLYSARSTANGYIFESLLPVYGFALKGTARPAEILSRNKTIYLGKSCDALNGDTSWNWTNDISGKLFAIEQPNGQRLTFYMIQPEISPFHDC